MRNPTIIEGKLGERRRVKNPLPATNFKFISVSEHFTSNITKFFHLLQLETRHNMVSGNKTLASFRIILKDGISSDLISGRILHDFIENANKIFSKVEFFILCTFLLMTANYFTNLKESFPKC